MIRFITDWVAHQAIKLQDKSACERLSFAGRFVNLVGRHKSTENTAPIVRGRLGTAVGLLKFRLSRAEYSKPCQTD